MDQTGSYVYLLYNSFPVQLLFTQCKDVLHIFLPLLHHFEARYSSNKSLGFPRFGFSSKDFLWFFFHVNYLLLQKANMIFFFFFPIVDPCPTTASWRSCWSRSSARSCGTPEPQKVFSDFQDSEPVSLNHTTYPAVPLCFRVLVHFPLFLYQPIPTEF